MSCVYSERSISCFKSVYSMQKSSGPEGRGAWILIYSHCVVIFFLCYSIFPFTWKYNIQANEELRKVKEKWSTIKLDFSVLSFSSFHKHKWCMLFLTRIKLVACVLACACAVSHIKWKRLHTHDFGHLYIDTSTHFLSMIFF